MRVIARMLWVLGLLAMLAPAHAQSRMQRGKLQQVQDAYAASIRWGEFENAWQAVDPAYRAEHPMTELEFERYKQVQISGYRDLSSRGGPDGTVERAVELRVINKHTMAERTERYVERWRWDPQAKRWWLVVGLPDLWKGQ
ncbi:hypothetical protein MUU77_18400 [Pseudoxanthomonas sp. F37]|jgi:hypothetical protein|uniref:hypothetical protein n=1 Tax=Pseudoxanthomonas TaxID=83618 RepID=UPI001FD23486|nr:MULTISPECIES: hypothetical protein [Pseudoxanthomonas]UOV03738.1 hypothetical protein MUU75_11170 [Pseudoxanthomonas mexicana]UOV08734.1 hypothetical protein MUU77_18400 [Pseudoxanthomonas sp. F37]